MANIQDCNCLEDKDMITDILNNQKNLIKRYTVALTEISCEKLRGLVDTKLSECAEDQFDAFLYMNERDLYPTEPAPSQKVKQAKQKFTQAKEQMK